ncbi:MAG: MFS family permease [Bradymonadia bacterium]
MSAAPPRPDSAPSHGLQGFIQLLRTRPNLRRLWGSTIVSLLGDWLSYVAVSLISIQQGEGALVVGMVLVAHALPIALLAPVAGALADRFDRRKMLIAAYLGASLLTVGMWVAATSASVWVVQALLFGRVAVSSLAMTARTALIPSVVEPEELHVANTLLGLTWSVLFAMGVALGGLLSAWLGAAEVIAIDAMTFVVAALLIVRLPAFPPKSTDRVPRPGLSEILFAWRLIRPSSRLTVTLLSKAPLAIATAASWVTLTLMAEVRLGTWSAAAGLGLMHAVRGIGTGIGPMLPVRWIPRVANRSAPIVFGGIALFLLSANPWLYFPALLLWGIGTGHNWVAATAIIQTEVPDQALGRVTSLDFLCFSSAQIVGAIGAGLLIDATGDPAAGAWLGCGAGVLGWLGLVVFERRGLRAQPPPEEHV